MEKQNADYERGYSEAIAVFESGFHPGYCQNNEQAARVTRNMWKAGLTGQEAQQQRSNFIAADRQRNQGSGAIQGSATNESGTFLKPSNHSGGESLQSIFDRRQLEAKATPSNVVGGKVQKIHHNAMEAK